MPTSGADESHLHLFAHEVQYIQSARPAVLLAPVVAGLRPEVPSLLSTPVVERETRLAIRLMVAAIAVVVRVVIAWVDQRQPFGRVERQQSRRRLARRVDCLL